MNGPRRLRIAMLAPPWIEIPPPAYGGIEEVVALLCEELVANGHDVRLYAAPGSMSAADVQPVLPETHPDAIERARYEADHVGRAFDDIEADGGFDVLHDHCGFTALAMAARLEVPVIHTIHGPIDDDEHDFYAAHGDKGTLVCLSRAQCDERPGAPPFEVVPNPIRVGDWPFAADKEDWLLWIGRMSPDKGPHRAIEAAREAGRHVVLAGPVQPGQERFFATEVEPHVDGARVRYVGEADAARKRDLYLHAAAVLMPIRWREPFGLVMVEAGACGTPVVAFAEGSAPEVVIDGETGFVVDDEPAMAAAIGRLGEIDPGRCRAAVAERFDAAVVASLYEDVYRRALDRVPARAG